MKPEKSFQRFLIIWFGQCLSSIGSGLTAFALAIYVYQITGSTTSYAFILLAIFLPSILLRPFGGILVDMFDRKRLMIIADLGSALSVGLILFMMLIGFQQIWVLYIGLGIASLFLALQSPAYKASITDLVDEADYGKASGLVQLAESSRYLVSPILAGFLMSIWNIQFVLLLDMISFLVAAVTIFAMKSTTPSVKSRQPILSHFMESFTYILKKKGLLPLLLMVTLVTFFVGFLQALWGPYVLSFADEKIFGTIQSLSATGMLFGSVFISFFSKTTQQKMILSLSMICAGIFYALLGTTTNTIMMIAVGFGFFVMLPFINTSLEVLIRQIVENKIQGRIWSMISLISQSGMLLAFSIAGPLADYVFVPLLKDNTQGIGLMFLLSGVFISLISLYSIRLFLKQRAS